MLDNESMMTPEIFMIFLIVATTTRGYDAQGTYYSDACNTFSPTGERILGPTNQRQVSMRGVFNLICNTEQKMTIPTATNVVAIIRRFYTYVKSDNIAELLAEKYHKLNKTGTNGTPFDDSLPDWFYNERTKTFFLDFPGFEDIRGPNFDIAVAHFNRLLLNKATRVKFILLENFSNLVEDGDSNALPTLLRHVTGLIKDLEKFNDSIALLARDVDSSESDEQVIQSMATFLNQFRGDSDRSEAEKELLEILLRQQPTDGSYLKIGLLRPIQDLRTDVNSLPIRKNKNRLNEIIYTNLNYTRVHDGDFGYTLSDSSILGIYQLVDDITNKIHTNMVTLTHRIAEAYFTTPQVNGQNKTKEELEAAYSYLLDVKYELEESEDLDHFIEDTIPEMETRFNVKFEDDIISTFKKNNDYLKFFLGVSEYKVVPKMWSRGFATAELVYWWQDNSEVEETETTEYSSETTTEDSSETPTQYSGETTTEYLSVRKNNSRVTEKYSGVTEEHPTHKSSTEKAVPLQLQYWVSLNSILLSICYKFVQII